MSIELADYADQWQFQIFVSVEGSENIGEVKSWENLNTFQPSLFPLAKEGMKSCDNFNTFPPSRRGVSGLSGDDSACFRAALHRVGYTRRLCPKRVPFLHL